MGLITRTTKPSAGTDWQIGDAVKAADINGDFNNAYTLVNGNIEAVNLASGAVTNAKVASDAIATDNIQDNAATTAKIAADAVDGTKIADDSIDSKHYAALSIDEEHIHSSAVTTYKIALDAIDNSRLADDAVQNENILNSTINFAKLYTATKSWLSETINYSDPPKYYTPDPSTYPKANYMPVQPYLEVTAGSGDMLLAMSIVSEGFDETLSLRWPTLKVEVLSGTAGSITYDVVWRMLRTT